MLKCVSSRQLRREKLTKSLPVFVKKRGGLIGSSKSKSAITFPSGESGSARSKTNSIITAGCKKLLMESSTTLTRRRKRRSSLR